MKMTTKALILPFLMAALLFAISACDGGSGSGGSSLSKQASKCPIELEIDRHRVLVTSLVDTVTIQNIQLNRGNVKLSDGLFEEEANTLPRTIKFGETTKFYAYLSNNSIREVVVQTNMGTWTFTLN